jgi:hypothetical protein
MPDAMPMRDRDTGVLNVDATVLTSTIDALHDCVHVCTADADADLREQHVDSLVKCIRLCLDCADVCASTASVITRRTAFDPNAIAPLVEACATICRISGDECERHPHEHCRLCAAACRQCEQACGELLAALTPR